jgi:hypothetical protein
MTCRFYRYILRHDNGMAPCIDGGLVTLATCKPQIRRGAKVGDWVAGFLPRPHERGLVAFAGRVAELVTVGKYEERFRGRRRDAIYRQNPDGTFTRLQPEYHPDDFRKDVSAPVLIFDRSATWYFGDHPQCLPEELSHLAAAGRPNRVNGATETDIALLEGWLMTKGKPGRHGSPRDRERGLSRKRKTC